VALTVIGVGLGRTGTYSLKLALEQLGVGRCYHMREVLGEPTRAQQWTAAAEGQPDWDAIFDGYAATTDYPACTFWREITQYYPQAKVLLSIRDPDEWFDSTHATIFSEAWNERCMASPFAEFFRRTVYDPILEHIDDRAFMTGFFRDHVAAVKASIPAERLLVYDVREGWEPLCEFFGLPVPADSFPRTHSRDEMIARLNAGEDQSPRQTA